MTAPRQVLPGASYLVTRRCTQRQYLLKPSRLSNDILLYLLAVAARRYGVKVHAYCFLSNHYHLLLTDPLAQLPAFQQFLDALAARALNSRWGRWESFWAPDTYSAVLLVSSSAVIDKAAYTLANPVAAGLVRSARKWPGLWSSPELIGAGPLHVRRPNHFFSQKGSLPESIQFQLTPPPGFTAESFREQLTTALADREKEALKSATGFLGVARILAQRATSRPRSLEPRRGLNPRVASPDKWKRIEALSRLKAFVASYRAALASWQDGSRDTLFPAGTYLMRVVHAAPCIGAG